MDEQYNQNGVHAPLTELSALDNLFAASGTATVKRTKNGVEEVLELPIQSVDIEEVNQIIGLPPKIPRVATGGNPKFVEDERDPAYVQKRDAHNRRFVMAMCCMGLAIDIKDRNGDVVWSADNKTRNLDKAMDVLRQMGIVYSQIFAITRAINELTTFAEEAATQD
jgi:hypothetical protein